MTDDERWAALKDWLGKRHETEHGLMESYQGELTGATSGAMVAVLRDVLAEMRRLEGER